MGLIIIMNLYKICVYLIVPYIILELLTTIKYGFFYGLLSVFIGLFLNLSFKKLLNEKFNYYKIDKLIYTTIFIVFFNLLMGLILDFIDNAFYLEFYSNFVLAISSTLLYLVWIKIGIILFKDNVGYQDLFKTYSKSIIVLYSSLIIFDFTIKIGNLLPQNKIIFIIPIFLIFAIVLIPSILATIRYITSFYKIFKKASQEEGLV